MGWPTTNDPRTEFVTLRLTVAEAAELDWLQGQINAKNRSAALRDALIRVCNAEHRRAKRTAKTGTPSEGQHDDD